MNAKKDRAIFRGVLIVFGLLLFTRYSYANPMAEAESFYKTGNYPKALKLYEQAMADAPQNAALFYNTANTYYKMNELGRAICFYRKAARLAPMDADIQYNLKRARLKTMDNTANAKGRLFEYGMRYLDRISYNALLWSALIVGTGFVMTVCLLLIGRRGELIRNLFFVLLVLTLIISCVFVVKHYDTFMVKEGVIIAKRVEVRSGPDMTLSTLFLLHDGTEVRIEDTVSQWAKIELKNGLSGWIKADCFWKI